MDGSDDKPIDVAIADMSSVLRPHLAIIDGTVGMEGLGPSAGQPKPLDVVVAGTDAFAADAVACRLMGTEAEQIPHLRIGAERGYGVIDLERIGVTPDDWQHWIQPFAPPPENLAIEFPNITVLDNNSCSACQSTLLLPAVSPQERPIRTHCRRARGRRRRRLEACRQGRSRRTRRAPGRRGRFRPCRSFRPN